MSQPDESLPNPEAITNAQREDPDVAEREALGRIMHAYREYRVDGEWEINRWEYNYSRLPDSHKLLLNNIPAKIAAAKQCVYQNHLFLKSLLAAFAPFASPDPTCDSLSFTNNAADEYAAKYGPNVNPQDADKVRYVFKNMMRDWSAEGAAERALSYGRITTELRRLFPPPTHTQQPTNSSHTNIQCSMNSPAPSVLVPGCGLGRLVAELAGLGFNAVGCEFSYYMLLASSFILNHTDRAEQWTIHPWVLHTCNHLSDADQLRPVSVPDIEPIELVTGGLGHTTSHNGSSSSSRHSNMSGSMSMCAGDFGEVFSKAEYTSEFDSVATCFFIDTAHNVVEYLETIWHCLKPGGWWINIGPLLWHWADSHTYLREPELSIELSLNDVLRIAQQIGFKIVKNEQCVVPYMSNSRSMLRQEYTCAFWVAQKPLETSTAADNE